MNTIAPIIGNIDPINPIQKYKNSVFVIGFSVEASVLFAGVVASVGVASVAVGSVVSSVAVAVVSSAGVVSSVASAVVSSAGAVVASSA